MAIDIVEQIITGGKGILTGAFPSLGQLDYEYELQRNSEKVKEDEPNENKEKIIKNESK